MPSRPPCVCSTTSRTSGASSGTTASAPESNAQPRSGAEEQDKGCQHHEDCQPGRALSTSTGRGVSTCLQQGEDCQPLCTLPRPASTTRTVKPLGGAGGVRRARSAPVPGYGLNRRCCRAAAVGAVAESPTPVGLSAPAVLWPRRGAFSFAALPSACSVARPAGAAAAGHWPHHSSEGRALTCAGVDFHVMCGICQMLFSESNPPTVTVTAI